MYNERLNDLVCWAWVATGAAGVVLAFAFRSVWAAGFALGVLVGSLVIERMGRTG